MKRNRMRLQDGFYALVLDEIRNQPGLEKELGANNLSAVALTAFGSTLKRFCQNIEMTGTGFPIPIITGPGFMIIRKLTPPATIWLRSLADILSIWSGSNYEALCRSALLHIFWGQLDEAERKINIAKNNHDDRAYAHHVYGLLRGLQEDREGSQFELGLAMSREGFESARQRVHLALHLLELDC